MAEGFETVPVQVTGRYVGVRKKRSRREGVIWRETLQRVGQHLAVEVDMPWGGEGIRLVHHIKIKG